MRHKPAGICSGMFHSNSQPRKTLSLRLWLSEEPEAGRQKCCRLVETSVMTATPRVLTGTSTSKVLVVHSVMSDSLQPHGLQHARLPCPSPSPRACSNSCPLSQ